MIIKRLCLFSTEFDWLADESEVTKSIKARKLNNKSR